MAEEIENESLDTTPDLKGISTVTGQETADSVTDTSISENLQAPLTPPTTPSPIDDGDGDDDKKKKKKKTETRKGEGTRKLSPSDAYIEPKTSEDAALSRISSRISSPSTAQILGTDLTFDKDAFNLYKEQFTPIDLANGIPDPVEREAYKEEHKDRIIQLLNPNTVGIRFENQIEDLAKFRQQGYDKNLRLFLDELDENQAWYETTFNNVLKLPAKLITGVAALIPLTYGLGKALFTMDSKYIFENGGFDLRDEIDKYIDKKLVVYGGYDYTQGDKPFYARFMDNPGKMINNDVVPIAGFVGSAVLTEMVAGALAPVTGGTSLLANSARLSAQAARTFGRAVKLGRGIDILSDVQKAEQLAALTAKFKMGYGTAAQMIRSSGYESALIARDTKRSTLSKSKMNYINSDPVLKKQYEALIKANSDSFGNLLTDIDTILNQVNIPNSVLKRMEFNSDQAGRLSYWSNVPLVGASNLIQFSKTFNTSYRVGQKIASQSFSVNPLRGVKYVTEAGKKSAVAAADKATRFNKILGYGMVAGKGFFTEAGEEFTQGVFEKGYSDYYSAPFTDKSLTRTKDFLTTMTNSARNYYNSVEGQDSIWLGGLAGMFGIGLPVRINQETGKLERGFQWYGGAYEEIKEIKEKIEADRTKAKYYNDNPLNPIAKNNFENYIREQQFQEEMDEAQKTGNRFQFENTRHKSIFSLVQNRVKNGIEDTLFADLDALDKMDLKTFNDNFAFKGYEYTEESKRDSIKDSRERMQRSLESIKKIDNIFQDKRVAVDRAFNKNFKGIEDPFALLEGVKEQMAFLYSTVLDYKQREKSLAQKVSTLTNGLINPAQFDKILAKYSTTKGNEVVLLDNAREFYRETLAEFKEKNPIDYATNEAELKDILQDLIKIKLNKAKVAEMYSVLATNKGMVEFADMYSNLLEARAEEVQKEIEEDNKNKAQKAKDESTIKKVTLDTSNPVSGNGTATTKTNEEVEKIIQDVEALRKSGEDITSDYVVEQLKKSPAFSLQVLEALGDDTLGANSIVELEEFIYSGEYPKLEGQLKSVFNKLLNQYSAANQTPVVSNVKEEPSPTVNSAQNLAEKYKLKMAQNKDIRIFDSSPVTPVSIMVNSQHKELVKDPHTKEYRGVRKDSGKDIGKFKDGSFSNHKGNKNPGKQNVDIELLLSPEFLNNKTLQEKDVQVTFKPSETNDYAQEDPHQRVIEVLYEGKVVGELPGWVEGRPAQLKHLREAIVKQAADEAVEGETAGFSGYNATIQVTPQTLTKEIYDDFIDTGEVPVTVLKSIAEKIKKGERLNDMERAVSTDFGEDIETMLKEEADKETITPETEVEQIAISLGTSIDKQIGEGGMGTAFKLKNGKILKITRDSREAKLAAELVKNPVAGLAKYESVNSIDDNTTALVMEELEMFSEQEQKWITSRMRLPFFSKDNILMYENTTNPQAIAYLTGEDINLDLSEPLPQTIIEQWNENKLSKEEKEFWESLSDQNYTDIINAIESFKLDGSELKGDNVGKNKKGDLVLFDQYRYGDTIDNTKKWLKNNINSLAVKTSEVETEVEQSAREKAIEENFNSIIKTLDSSKLMLDTDLDGNYIGKKKC